MNRIGVFFAEGYEEIEALTVVDLLRRADIQADMVSITAERTVKGSHGIAVGMDQVLSEADFGAFDGIVLPGGMPGTLHLKAHEGLADLIRKADKEGKLLAAICAAPTIYGEMGLLEGKTATCYPGMEDKLLGANWQEQPVVVDGNFVTSRGVGTAIAFALAIVEYFSDHETAASLGEKFIYHYE